MHEDTCSVVVMRIWLSCIGFLVVSCPLNHEAFAKTIIDSFTSGDVELVADFGADVRRPGYARVLQTDLNDVLGNHRTLNIEFANATMRVVADGGGRLEMSSQSRAEEMKIEYGTTSPLNLDLTDPSKSVLAVDFIQFEPVVPNPRFKLSLRKQDGSRLRSLGLLDVELSPTPGERVVLFSLSEVDENGSLADVDVIAIEYLTAYPGFEFSISEISLVPEPSCFVLLIVGAPFLVRLWLAR